MNHVESFIVITAYCLQYGCMVMVGSVAVAVLISGLDWFLEGVE